jgi:hypothetical protein
MLDDFKDWYRRFLVEPNDELTTMRMAGVEAAAGQLTNDLVVELVRSIYQLPLPSVDPVLLRAHLRSADAMFSSRHNEEEIRLLSEATLCLVLRGNASRKADVVALAASSAACGGLRGPTPLQELPTLAANYLTQRALNVRRSASLPEIPTSAILTKPPQDAEFAAALVSLGEATARLGTSVERAVARLERSLMAAHEEADILWWLFGGFSSQLNMPIRDVPTPAATLIVGAELQQHSRFVPRPFAAAALIARALTERAEPLPMEVSIADAVNTTPRDFREAMAAKRARPDVPADLIPIMTAIRLSVVDQVDAGWLTPFKTQVHLDPLSTMSPVVRADQIGIELDVIEAFSRGV